MAKIRENRRQFLKNSVRGVVGASMAAPIMMSVPLSREGRMGTPAILGGNPVHKGPWPVKYPLYNECSVFKYLREVLYGGKWIHSTGDWTVRFNQAIAEKYGVRYCFSTNSGTSALDCALSACEVGPGDEVIVPGFTFISGVNMPLNRYALPVLVDVEKETLQINPTLIEERITEHSKAIMLCHYSGSPANMDAIMPIARKHNLRVIEDVCETAVGSWRGQNLGTFGNANALSHQQSKMLPVGEGGHVIGNDQAAMERGYSWHDCGRKIKNWHTGLPENPEVDGWKAIGLNYNMTEFQAAVGLANLEIFDEQCAQREGAGKYLDQVLPTIPGIAVQKHYPGTTRASYYYALMRYDSSGFHGLPVRQFVAALQAEGIPVGVDSDGPRVGDFGKEPFLIRALHSRDFQRIYSKERLEKYRKTLYCPVTEELCRAGIVTIFGHYFLVDRRTLDTIPDAIRKVQYHSALLASRLSCA